MRGMSYPDLPEEVRQILNPEEQILYAAKESKVLGLTITPDWVCVTDQRIILYQPSMVGLRKKVVDYAYSDVANVIQKRGVLGASIALKVRYLSKDLELGAIPKDQVPTAFKIIREQIQRAQAPKAVPAAAPAASAAPPAPMSSPAVAAGMMFCRECGKQIPRESKFCQACGAKVA